MNILFSSFANGNVSAHLARVLTGLDLDICVAGDRAGRALSRSLGERSP